MLEKDNIFIETICQKKKPDFAPENDNPKLPEKKKLIYIKLFFFMFW